MVNFWDMSFNDMQIILDSILQFFISFIDFIFGVFNSIFSVFGIVNDSIGTLVNFFNSESGFMTIFNQSIGVMPAALIAACVVVFGMIVVLKLSRII